MIDISPLSMISPIAVLGLPYVILSQGHVASWIVKYSSPSNTLSLYINILNFAVVTPAGNLTLASRQVKSVYSVN